MDRTLRSARERDGRPDAERPSNMTNQTTSSPASGQALAWLPIAAVLLLMFVPTYVEFANSLWTTEEHGHGPLILAVSAYYAWVQRHAFVATEMRPKPVLGGMVLAVGCLLYVVGTSQGLAYFEASSIIFVLIGAVLVVRGVVAVKAMWFPLFFLLFSVPLPGMIVDLVTQSLKNWVSVVAESLLYSAGYPIARVGVTLVVGQYQLLVADACSGLNSMFSLSAMGILYLYMMKHKSWLRNAIILAAILPIAFAANIVRVMVLVLITYHLGDEAGQGFMHGFAGMMLFVVALALLFGLDGLLGFVFRGRRKAPTAGG